VKTIEIPDALFQRLQKHATPLVDTPVSVMERWADSYELHNTKPASTSVAPSISVAKLDVDRPPNLTHTRVSGDFGGTLFREWNDLLRIAHIQAFNKAGSFEALQAATLARIRKGAHTVEGFRFIPDIGVSLQGVDANHAWEYALRLAKFLGVSVKAEVEWRNNPKAARPGERATLVWP